MQTVQQCGLDDEANEAKCTREALLAAYTGGGGGLMYKYYSRFSLTVHPWMAFSHSLP